MTHMKARGRIVVGVDGSAAVAAAVRWAVREARLRRTVVHLVCAGDSDVRLRAPYASWSSVTREDERFATAEATLATAAELARPYLPPERLTTELAHEPAARALLDRTADAEMLVLGATWSDGGKEEPSHVIGPVARACLRSAHCPVVVVAPDDQVPVPSPAPRRRPASAPAS